MGKSKVFFTDMHTTIRENLQGKLERLLRAAGMETIDFQNKFAAIKMHFGEPGNLAYLRPNYAKTVADFVKKQGGKPFLTDCNTLYVGGRKNALLHLDSAALNGFSYETTGCRILIADGLKGTDEALVPVPDGQYVKEAKIGRTIMDADIIISLSHFKGHELTGIGGAIKNIGMGCGSRAGKMEMHSNGKPDVNQDDCVGCGTCTLTCEPKAIRVKNKKASVDHDLCVGCGRCIGVCPTDAVQPVLDEANDILGAKMAEYTWAVLHGKPNFHISLVVDVSPFCDCHAENDIPIVPDVGMFASFDPVALDVACTDAVNKQTAVKGSLLEKHGHEHHDHFTDVSPDTNWNAAIDHSVRMGLGNREYELIKI
ncbi:MAG TPA: 4Fe-4S ferredoxin [Ruminococcaceae bacterium]|nr:4Fe-4S ferredoxin [Oscillospiraceae bacterium]